MAVVRKTPSHSTDSTSVADLLERVLDKGVMIAGDIKVSLLDIELLTIQIRLVVCSIDKAKEMGMDWWANSPVFGNDIKKAEEENERLTDRIAELERQLEHTALAEPKPSNLVPAATAPTVDGQPVAVQQKPIDPPPA
ncbi:MAG: gas vesicle protein GvpJ, partial [Planctomycetota bacterium]